MSIYALISGCILGAFVILWVVVRRLILKNRATKFYSKINSIQSYENDLVEEPYGSDFLVYKERVFTDIATDLECCFNQSYIKYQQKNEYVNYYVTYYKESKTLVDQLRKYGIKPSNTVLKFINDFENIDNLIKKHNQKILNIQLEDNRKFFDQCLKYPLDEQQRRAIVSEEDNCLVVSSAGSGKTSSIVGKVKYLIEIKGIDPSRILLISYTNKAANELTERMGVGNLQGYTFHKLALDLVGRCTGEKPLICENTDALFVKIYRDLLSEKKFRKHTIKYLVDYNSEDSDSDKQVQERRQQLSEQKSARLKALLPDMDGKPIYVRSEQEQKICFILSSLGVKFRYEDPYEYSVADEMHSQYKPDFSIYFECEGTPKRLYLEHFGVDNHGLVPLWFAKERNISYEEANRRYNDGITWKKAVHEKFGTKLIITKSADFNHTDIRETIKTLLLNAGVSLNELSETELYNMILPNGSKQEKAFIRLIVTFVTLFKSGCRSFNDLIMQVNNSNDERNKFVINNIFRPVYERYEEYLHLIGQIDFTDAILQATELCKMSHPVSYDYIIVDEFQDISVDRYNFLKALRECNPLTKLYCVGDDWQSIYRFSGSDMSLFNNFADFFGPTEINKIETTYRFGIPLVDLSAQFIQRNVAQIKKNIKPYNPQAKTDLSFQSYDSKDYCQTIINIVDSIPINKSIFLLGRYSFDDYYLSYEFKSIREGNRFFYIIGNRKIEFLTVHKSKGLEADYVIILQCNKDTYGFPSLINDDSSLQYVLTEGDCYPFSEERRLFYVAITRAKIKTWVLYDKHIPSIFVDEFLRPQNNINNGFLKYPNAMKRWTPREDQYLLSLYRNGKSIKYIAEKMGRSQKSIVMRLGKLETK